jgi:hypothetical protein
MSKTRFPRKIKKEIKIQFGESAYFYCISILKKKFVSRINSEFTAHLGKSLAEEINKDVIEALKSIGGRKEIANPYYKNSKRSGTKNLVDIEELEKDIFNNAMTPGFLKNKESEEEYWNFEVDDFKFGL